MERMEKGVGGDAEDGMSFLTDLLRVLIFFSSRISVGWQYVSVKNGVICDMFFSVFPLILKFWTMSKI